MGGSTLPAIDLEEVIMNFQTFSRQTVRVVVVGAAALAILAPAAFARFDDGSLASDSPVAESPRCPAPPPSSIAASAGERYATWRAACANRGTALASAPQPVVSEATASFDWAAAAIGAAVAGGSLLLLLSAVTLRRHTAARTTVSG
jgi:hypothetical protein